MKGILKHKKLLIITGLLFVVIVFIANGVAQRREDARISSIQESVYLEDSLALQEAQGSGSDNLLLQMQPDLIKDYGQVPDGYIWDFDGTLLSLGDPSMSAEEVVYAYLNGLRTLDFSMAQKYSRDSVVLDTYMGYFDDTNKNSDYTDQFMRNMYREALLSMNVLGIVTSSVFAENMQVFTVRVEMLDLTNKDFWLNDKMEIYRNLDIYDSDQSDSTRAEIYLYDYILNYYSNPEARTRELTFDLTVQKYPDLNTGWLVSVDTDIDNACRYADGRLVVSYIQEMYYDEGMDLLSSAAESYVVTYPAPSSEGETVSGDVSGEDSLESLEGGE